MRPLARHIVQFPAFITCDSSKVVSEDAAGAALSVQKYFRLVLVDADAKINGARRHDCSSEQQCHAKAEYPFQWKRPSWINGI